MEKTVIKDIWRFNKGVRIKIEQNLSVDPNNDLSLIQCLVLVMLACRSKELVGAKELQEIFVLSKATISETLSALENKEYIVVTQSLKDKRRNDIVLTPKGESYVRNAHRRFNKLQESLVADIDENDVQTFKRVLEKMGENLRRAK